MSCKIQLMFILSAFLLAGVVGAEEKPIPRPVSPPLPIPGHDSTTTPRNGIGGVAKPDTPSPKVVASPIADYVDLDTSAVSRIDLSSLDLKQAQDWILSSVEELRRTDPDIAREKENVAQALGQTTAWVEKLKSAGAKELYVVFSLADMNQDRPPFLVVPLHQGADEKAIAALLEAHLSNGAAVRTEGKVIVAALPATFDRLKAAKSAARPDIWRALEEAGPAPVRFVLTPEEGARKMLESMTPQLPDDLGGGPISILSRGMKWASLGITLPPGPSVRLVIQGTDPDAAKKLYELAQKAIAWAGDRKHGPREALAYADLVSKLRPKLEGDRVIVELKEAELRNLAAAIAASASEARNNAKSKPEPGERPQ